MVREWAEMTFLCLTRPLSAPFLFRTSGFSQSSWLELCLTMTLALIIVRHDKLSKYYQSTIPDFLLQACNPIISQTCSSHNSSRFCQTSQFISVNQTDRLGPRQDLRLYKYGLKEFWNDFLTDINLLLILAIMILHCNVHLRFLWKENRSQNWK